MEASDDASQSILNGALADLYMTLEIPEEEYLNRLEEEPGILLGDIRALLEPDPPAKESAP
jgi:hypothetical protein